jgi:hypothetical protein
LDLEGQELDMSSTQMDISTTILMLDILNTAAEVYGANLTRNKTYDGVNLNPDLSGRKECQPHEVLYWRQGTKAALRAGDWKIHRDPQTLKWQLLNLMDDLEEKKPEATSSEPEKLKVLMDIWRKMDLQMVDPIWTRN